MILRNITCISIYKFNYIILYRLELLQKISTGLFWYHFGQYGHMKQWYCLRGTLKE
jgi:hypothetical protein